MRIVLTGGGTGGHFYPLIAVMQGIEDICTEKHLIEPEFFYMGPKPFDMAAFTDHDVQIVQSPAGKLRKGESARNAFDSIKTFFGAIRCLFSLFSIYPDVVFSTGGYAAFPTLFAAKILRIPVIIYDADAHPGRVSLWSAKFAKWIAVAHPDAARAFPVAIQKRIARTGHPIRKEIIEPAREGGHEFLKLDPKLKTLFVMGGSQGAQTINEAVLDALPNLLERYNVVHQAGRANLEEVEGIAGVSLHNSQYRDRYRVFGLLNVLALRMAAGITTIVLARAGSGTIFEVSSWGIPAILVPIPDSVSNDQTENAFSYARAGGAVVIEQRNLTPHVLIAEIDRLMNDTETLEQMKTAAAGFARPDAGRKVAQIILESALEHQPK